VHLLVALGAQRPSSGVEPSSNLPRLIVWGRRARPTAMHRAWSLYTRHWHRRTRGPLLAAGTTRCENWLVPCTDLNKAQSVASLSPWRTGRRPAVVGEARFGSLGFAQHMPCAMRREQQTRVNCEGCTRAREVSEAVSFPIRPVQARVSPPGVCPTMPVRGGCGGYLW